MKPNMWLYIPAMLLLIIQCGYSKNIFVMFLTVAYGALLTASILFTKGKRL